MKHALLNRSCSFSVQFYIFSSSFLTFSGILALLSYVVLADSCINAAGSQHLSLLTHVFRWPMFLFDSTPVGRLVNRFSKDMDSIDVKIPDLWSDFLYCLFDTLSIFVVIAYSTPYFLTMTVPFCLLYLFVQVNHGQMMGKFLFVNEFFRLRLHVYVLSC